MEPPICDVCDERFDPGTGQRIRFLATDAGQRFDTRTLEPGFVGDHPDEGWFCADHASGAAALAATHTRSAAIAKLRDGVPGRAIDRTPTRHELSEPTPVTDVVDAFRSTLATVLTRLGLDSSEPTTDQHHSTAPGPEWREDITTTELVTTETWADANHRIVYGYRDIRWDSWSGTPRAGDLLQGTVSLKIDDHWLFASFGSDTVVTRLDESGPHQPITSDTVDLLLDQL